MGTDKALLPWPPSTDASKRSTDTFLSAAIRSLSGSTDFVVIVAGRNQSALAPVVYAQGASLVVNPEPDQGQFSSLRVGLQEVLNRGRDTAIITLVDRPAANANTVRQLREEFEAAPQNVWAVVPELSGKHGHPFIAGRELIEVFLRAPTDASARDIEHQHQEHIRYVAVDDPFVVMNINTPKDYAALTDES